jgi:hypothetical protein
MTKISNIDEANALLSETPSLLKKIEFGTGISEFDEIINSSSRFVDKSLFIKAIFNSKEGVTLITRPRRWGKTLGLSMLQHFLGMEVDVNGQEVVPNSNRHLFNNLQIAKTKIIAEQGRHPVIFICLKDIKADSYEETETNLKSLIADLFEQYEYIAKSLEQSSSDISRAHKITLKKFFKLMDGESDVSTLKSSLKLLMRLIRKHHGKKTYLLIDEYDAPLNYAYNTPHYEKTLELIKGLFSITLKGNTFLKKAVITGVFKIAKSGLFSGLNNSSDYSILSEQYAEYFGFTEGEVDALLTEANIKDKKIKSAVRDWYNGYNIGGLTIYNPWSIINFFTRLKIAPYWVNTESMVAGDRRLSTDLMVTEKAHKKVNLLIANFGKELTEMTINPEVVFSTIQEDVNSLFGLLLFGGYLSVDTTSYNVSGMLICQARIPNREVLSIYNSSISLWVEEQLAIDQAKFESLGEEFILEDINSVRNTVNKALEIFGDRIAEKNESIFHGLIQSICLLKGDQHRLASESYTGQGRADSIFYPIAGKSDTVIIHEYKIIKNIKTIEGLKTSLEDAMWQIYNRTYSGEILAKNLCHDLGFKYIEVRAIVIVCDDIFHKTSTQIIAIKHTFAEMQRIVQAFTLEASAEDSKLIDKVADDVVLKVSELFNEYEKHEKKLSRKLKRK